MPQCTCRELRCINIVPMATIFFASDDTETRAFQNKIWSSGLLKLAVVERHEPSMAVANISMNSERIVALLFLMVFNVSELIASAAILSHLSSDVFTWRLKQVVPMLNKRWSSEQGEALGTSHDIENSACIKAVENSRNRMVTHCHNLNLERLSIVS